MESGPEPLIRREEVQPEEGLRTNPLPARSTDSADDPQRQRSASDGDGFDSEARPSFVRAGSSALYKTPGPLHRSGSDIIRLLSEERSLFQRQQSDVSKRRGSLRDMSSDRLGMNESVDSVDSAMSTPGTQERLEERLQKMKRRFESLRALNEIDTAADEDMYKTLGGDSSPSSSALLRAELTPPGHHDVKHAAARGWSNLRKVVKAKGLADIVPAVLGQSASEAKPPSVGPEAQEDTEAAALPDADTAVSYWKGLTHHPPVVNEFSLVSSFPLDAEETRLGETTGAEDYLREFSESAGRALLEVRHVPEELVQRRRDELETSFAIEQRAAAEERLRQEAELVWREHGARVRVRDLEAAMWARLAVEKRKMAEVALEREQILSWQFRKAREYLEEGLMKQLGEIRERYGELSADRAARMYDVFSSQKPNPIEVRVHLLRAVKNKLPKGAYVVMLTQYDKLGGSPLKWSKIGSFGMSIHNPGVTRPVKHYGRYFDRVMRFEDSVFALCPPRRDLKPSYILVLEIFRLANRSSPEGDVIVGWTALPMCLENLSIIEGKYKLPMLKGEHTSSTQHFRDIEKSIAVDLDNWLCNIYIEVRHLPLSVVDSKNEISYNFIDKRLEVKAASKSDYLNQILYHTVPALMKSGKSRKQEVGLSKKDDDRDIEQGVLEEADTAPLLRDKSGLPFFGLFSRHQPSKDKSGLENSDHVAEHSKIGGSEDDRVHKLLC